ncbi:MAG TPA: DUF4340 domain-containing protein [Polyangia bacterium]|jgi:hypothetical protein
MNRKTQIAFAAFVVLGLITFFALRQPDKGEVVGERPRPVPRLKAGDFDTLAVIKGGVTSVVKKTGDSYQVLQPTNYKADETAAKQAFEGLEKMEFSSIVSDQKAKQGEYEVGDNGLRVTAKKGDTILADLIIGKGQGAGTMVRPVGKDEIWLMAGAAKYTFDKSAADWRDKSIVTFPAGDAETIDIKSKTGGTIKLKRGPKKDGGADEPWTIADSSVKIEKPDNGVAGTLISTLSSLKASDFADNATPQETGLTDPALTVTVGLKGGKTVTALVGNKKGDDDYYVKNGTEPQVFLVKKFNVTNVNKRPIDFKDKMVCDIVDPDLTEIVVSHGAESFTLAKDKGVWKATKPAKLEVDGAKATNVAATFKDLKATGFADDPSPKATGLVKPAATLVAKSKTTVCSLKIGDQTTDKQSYNVQSIASADTYLIPKWSLDRVLVKTTELKKADAAKK